MRIDGHGIRASMPEDRIYPQPSPSGSGVLSDPQGQIPAQSGGGIVAVGKAGNRPVHFIRNTPAYCDICFVCGVPIIVIIDITTKKR